MGLKGAPFYAYRTQITGFLIAAIALCGLSLGVLLAFNKTKIFRLVLSGLILITLILGGAYLLVKSGILQKISSIKELREYIKSFGAQALIATLIMQILQVVALPIPGVIAIGVAVALFGPLKGAIISFIGIFLGSMIAFFIGRKLGKKAVCWIVGEDTLNKVQASVKGKDKIVLTFMFLFPFFPDDVLCFVAGLSTIPTKYFVIMIIITRIISVTTTAFSVNGNMIPYDTWWGILIWAALILTTFIFSYYFYKNSDKIKFFSRPKKHKK
jgi:uncharacterized membrane protein YdjX (TVP38/TMEM64 family)